MSTPRSLRSPLLAAAAVLLLACGGEDPEPPPDAPIADPPTTAPPPSESDEATPQDDGAEVTPDLGVDVVLTEVATGGSFTAAATGPDGVMYVAERGGTVHPVGDDGLEDPVVDLSAETTTDGERGLLGLAFAADGTALYLSSTDADGDSVISRVPVDGDAVDDDAREVVLTLGQPQANHNGGDIAVGPDGLLYVAFGDGGGGGDPQEAGQDLSTMLGTILRLDPEGGDPYAVPSDNPFVGTDEARAEIWAYGLRNPWRFSFDTATDHLWIADVGQNTREEINRVTLEQAPGANFGWNLMEGTLEFAGEEPAGHVPPVYEYDTGGDEGCSITGGYVYRGEAVPELTGVYLYADFCNGTVRGLLVDDDGEVTDQAELSIDGGQVVSFAQDADGEVYVLDLGGTLSRIDPA